jgi:hypothetical protein
MQTINVFYSFIRNWLFAIPEWIQFFILVIIFYSAYSFLNINIIEFKSVLNASFVLKLLWIIK